jgi:PAS domain S-box-containing protein
MASDAATAASSFPIRLLTIALVLTTVTIAWFGWIIFDQRRDAKMFQGESLRIEELRGVIVHLDEVLTMSARMAAATGDLKWEERYRRFEPQLDAAIKETIRLGTDPSSVKTTAQTDVANIKLVEMENRAFALVRAGRKEEAQTVLFSAEYETQKQIYAEGIMSFASQIGREADERERQGKRIDFLSMIGALVVLTISFAAWLSVVRGLQRWRADLEQAVSEREQAQQALRRANDELEARVTARTGELGKTNQALQAEITGRKQIEEELQRQKTELRVLFDWMPAMVWFKDTENRILRVNKRAAEIVGKPVEEIEGKPSLEIFPQEAAKYYSDDLEVIHSGAPKLGIVETIRDREGKEQWGQTDKVPVCDQDGKVTGIIVMTQDITERKRAEEALRASQQIIEGIINAIPVRVFWKDKNLVYLGCNAIFARDAGFAGPKDIIGKDDYQMGWREQAEKYRGDDRQVIESGCSKLLIEEPQTTPEGNTITLLSSKIPLRSSQGEISGLLGTYMDITERKRLEAQLLQSQKMETIGKLAGGIAHEFNSILTTIIGHSEFLLNDLPAGSPLANNATEISKAAGRAATLTRQLLAYGRKQFLQPENLDLNQVIASMEGIFHHLMGIDVDTQIVPAAGLKAVNADAGQIEQVIMNMAINARDAMPNGGKLTLETANVSFDRESVGRNPELKPGDYVMLAITDTGAGMSEEVKAHLFEPFFSTKGVGRGTGLGLSTCHGIIKQSGGHIGLYSEPGRGTTFKIYLPQVEPQTKIPMQRLNSPDLPRGTETILLVEDDPALREMAATLLRRLGYTVLAAANGIEALSLKQQRDNGHIDLLFTDVVMPHMNGQELSERVRALYPHTRILFTSAYTENAIVHQGVLDQGVALLQKPFTPSALAHKLREVLDQPNASKPAYAGPEPATGIAGEATVWRRPDLAEKTSGFTKITDEVKTPGN